MSCCGNKRELLMQPPASEKISDEPVVKMWADVNFTYTGKTSLTVKGSVSRNIYRFTKTGDVVLVDYRDASGMMAVLMLKKTALVK